MVAVGCVEPDYLALWCDGEAESVPAGLALLTPELPRRLNAGPQVAGASFPYLAGSVRIRCRQLAPRTVLAGEEHGAAESLTAEQRLIEPDEVAQYVNFFDHLDAVAATGPDAAVLIQQVAAELRGRRNIGR